MKLLWIVLDVIVIVSLVALAKALADVVTPRIDEDTEIADNGNMAFATSRAGLYLGMMIALAPLLGGVDHSFFSDLSALLPYGLSALVLFFLARAINDRFLLPSVDNNQACKNHVNSVGVCEFGSYLATGLIINGCLTGSSRTLAEGLLSVAVFFALGQLVLHVMSCAYQTSCGFDCREKIARGNLAASVSLSAKLIAVGIILRSSIAGDFGGWVSGLKGFGIAAATGILLILIAEKFESPLFLPKGRLDAALRDNDNLAVVVVMQGVLLGTALLISSALQSL